MKSTASVAWAATSEFFPAVWSTVNTGQAWDSLQGTIFEFEDAGGDLILDAINAGGHFVADVKSDFFGETYIWKDWHRAARFRDYTPPLFGHTLEERRGAQVGAVTARVEVIAVMAWQGAELIIALPGLFTSAGALGEGLLASLGVSEIGAGLGIGTLVPSSLGGYLGVGTLGTLIGGIGAGIGSLNDSRVFDPLKDWFRGWNTSAATTRLPGGGTARRMAVEELLEDGGYPVRRIGGLDRPPLDAATKAKIEAAADRNALGQFVDKKGRILKRPSYGHVFGRENRRIVAAGERLGLNQEQQRHLSPLHPVCFFVQEYADNVAHVGELPGDGNLEEIIKDMERFFGLK